MNIKFIFPTLFLVFTLCGSSLLAQQVDVEKMDRDLKVAAAALGTLVETKQQLLLARREDRQTAQYLEGYGVMMTLPAQHSVTVLAPNVYRGAGTAQIRGVEPSSQRRIKVGKTFDQGAGASQIRGFEPSSPTGTIRIGKSLTETADAPKEIDRDSLSQVQTDQLKEQVTIFLLEYADLIGQLQPENRIKIVEERSPFVSQGRFLQSRPSSPMVMRKQRFSAEIKKSDLTAFKAGELSREEVVGRILFSESLAEGLDQDLELLANILDRLYRPDLSETFYYTGYAYYDKIPEFGVIYHLNMLTRTEKNLYNFILPSDKTVDLQEESDPEKLTALYPGFLEGLKENILTYGRTVKSMDRTERLVFNIRLSNCTGCDVPGWVNVSIGMADLFDYDAGKLSKVETLQRFKVGTGS
ncbi:MAG TPA: hypothetical protein VK957_12435 [Lunatimonas sp.]|nr:hypothetical protein [Lunatimonas sp.]